MKNNNYTPLKSAYEKRQMMPSENLWEKIEQQMDNQPFRTPKKQLLWWPYAAVLTLTAGLGILFFINDKKENIPPNVLVQTTTKTEQTKKEEPSTNIIAKNNDKKVEYRNDKNFAIAKKSDKIKNDDSTHPTLIKKKPDTSIAKRAEDTIHTRALAENKKQDVEEKEYISADDLLFGRELDKQRDIEKKSPTKMVYKSPKIFSKNMEILGIPIYSEDSK